MKFNTYEKRSDIPENYKWDLSKMYSSIKDVDKDIETVKSLTPQILEYKGHILDSSNSLYEFMTLTEKQDRLLEKLYVYSKMSFDVNTKDNTSKALKMKIEKLSDDLNEAYSFITPEFMESSYDKVLEFIKENPKLEEYRFNLECIYRYKEHSLSKIEEDIFVKALKERRLN